MDKEMQVSSKAEKPSIFEARESAMLKEEKTANLRAEIKSSSSLMRNLKGTSTY